MTQSTSSQEAWPAPDELQALGSVIRAASQFEHELGVAFCALVGSKYASILVGNKTSSGLIEDCRALAKVQRELDQQAKDAICSALSRCAEANTKRNRLIHNMWASGPEGVSHQLQRQRHGYDISSRPVTKEEIASVARDLTRSSVELNGAIFDSFGPDRATLEVQLRWEDNLARMAPEEKSSLMRRRLIDMLREMESLLERYGETAMAGWCSETAQQVDADRSAGLKEILDSLGHGGFSSLTLDGQPRTPVPRWLKNQDPNAQLIELKDGILQLAHHLYDSTE